MSLSAGARRIAGIMSMMTVPTTMQTGPLTAGSPKRGKWEAPMRVIGLLPMPDHVERDRQDGGDDGRTGLRKQSAPFSAHEEVIVSAAIAGNRPGTVRCRVRRGRYRLSLFCAATALATLSAIS